MGRTGLLKGRGHGHPEGVSPTRRLVEWGCGRPAIASLLDLQPWEEGAGVWAAGGPATPPGTVATRQGLRRGLVRQEGPPWDPMPQACELSDPKGRKNPIQDDVVRTRALSTTASPGSGGRRWPLQARTSPGRHVWGCESLIGCQRKYFLQVSCELSRKTRGPAGCVGEGGPAFSRRLEDSRDDITRLTGTAGPGGREGTQ